MKRKFFSELALALALFTISGCNAEEPVNITPSSKKILIAVFSYTGNTRQAAQAIQRKTGGTLIEIEPETPYSQDYQAVVKQGKEEVDSGFLPKLKTKAANIRDYDVIFVGSPIWWYTIAPPVASLRMTPKNSCSSIPSQKAGTATRIDVVSVTKISQKE